ncbi:carboxymuconolactone decarboxylase family protein [Pseudomonas fluorescens]|uniref:carboxymuconolactone decarboxylase family protein n=1 Tax=Pseudomonas fluorescens TaxID=294 RepID=UPI000AA7ED0B|nr:carboxymuconolactone decarboxylase family protein [Pseudomonas fluorescens]
MHKRTLADRSLQLSAFGFGCAGQSHGYGPATDIQRIAEPQWTEPSTMATDTRSSTTLPALMALCLSVGAMFSLTTQAAEAPQSMTTLQTTAKALSSKQQTIPLIAAFMATSDMANLNTALNQTLDAGLTISETREILVQLYAYVGFPRSLNALNELMTVVQARKQRGIEDAPGREPSQAIPVGDELLAAGTANQTKISGAPVKGPVFEFAPVINQFLQTHLFGDIFERDNLDWQSRELATVGALAATPGVESQLRAHMAASLRVGLSAAQLGEVTELLKKHGDAQTAERANAALKEALAASKQ